MADIRSQDQMYQDYITELQTQAPELTDDNEGSINDVLAGVTSFAVSEISRLALDEFKKTFFDTAGGPAVTGNLDDLQTLAVDHFGANFARPQATFAAGVVTFSRATTDAGNVVIPINTVVKTVPDANGNALRFRTETAVTLTGLTVNVIVNASTQGVVGNVLANTVVLIESTLTDPTVSVSNSGAFAGGAETQDDVTYRETIRNRLTTLTGATLTAMEAAAKNVSGVATTTAVEAEQVVIEYDISTSLPKAGAAYFRIPKVQLYIADANGTADDSLIASVLTALQGVRAAGVRVDVLGAIALSLDWSATITLNPAGPNYASLSASAAPIVSSMQDYINGLDIGSSFIRTDANAAILAIWGSAGTNDLVSFVTNTPSGNVPADVNQKLIPGTVTVA